MKEGVKTAWNSAYHKRMMPLRPQFKGNVLFWLFLQNLTRFWCCVSWLYGTLYIMKNKWLTKRVLSQIWVIRTWNSISPRPCPRPRFDTWKEKNVPSLPTLKTTPFTLEVENILSKNWILVLNKRKDILMTPPVRDKILLNSTLHKCVTAEPSCLEHLPVTWCHPKQEHWGSVRCWKVCRKLF